MIQLFIDGALIAIGDDRGPVFDTFENRVTKWNDEFSGWDANGEFLRIAFLADVTEYSPTEGADPDMPVPLYLGE